MKQSLWLLIGSIIFFSCSQKRGSNDYRGKSISYFYTDFDANHNGENLFDSALYKPYEWMTLKEGELQLDSSAFDSLYNKVLNLKIDTNEGWLNYFGVYYQFILKNNDSLERLIVLNNENYFSTDGVKFVRDDTLAFQLKNAFDIYSRFSFERRKEVFREYDLFNLDTIPYIPRDTSLNGYLYYRGRLLRQ